MFTKLKDYLSQVNDDRIISYKALRRLIGILGIMLPFVCVLGGWLFSKESIQSSISLYYYTNMRDFLVGLLFLVSMFLITYKGKLVIDMVVSTITGIAGLGVAIFPCLIEQCCPHGVGIFQLYPVNSNVIHLTCAALFFTLLAINSIFLFTRLDKPVTPEKLIRNRIYITCGIIILACLVGLVISMILSPEFRANTRIILILETIALLAFGTSWLIKGETLFVDKQISN